MNTLLFITLPILKSLETGEPCDPTFKDALETQKVCEAVLTSAKSGNWKDMAEFQ